MMLARTEPMALSVQGVSHRFGARAALTGVSFEVAAGSFTVLLGLNGAGKTTLFALITRLYHAQTGRIEIFGNDMRTAPTRGLAKLGVVFQQPTLDLDLTVRQNLEYHAALYGIARKDARPRIDAEIARVNLSDRMGDKSRNLSGGQRRRVELARAMIHRPAILLMDEPTVGLDVESRAFLLGHVRTLCEQGVAVLWATHLMDEAAHARVLVLHKGSLRGDEADAADVPATFARLTAASGAA